MMIMRGMYKKCSPIHCVYVNTNAMYDYILKIEQNIKEK